MSAATGTSKTGRRMRVATAFTGVATATLGLGQAAQAQSVARPHVVKAAATYGSIKMVRTCGGHGIDKTWVHVSTQSSSSQGDFWAAVSLCFGNKGDYFDPPGVGVAAECGGNNHGFMVGLNHTTGYSWVSDFGPGTTYREMYKSHLSTVAISGWAGTDTCPKIPDYGYGGGA